MQEPELGKTHKRALSLGMAFALALATFSPVALVHAAAPNPPLVLIMLENTEFFQVVGNLNANYLNCGGTYAATGFLCQGTLYQGSYSAQHPSLANYLDLTSGGDNGCLVDSCPSSGFSEPSLFGQLVCCGDVLRVAGGVDALTLRQVELRVYSKHHNPEIYFTDVATMCSATDVGVTDSFPGPDAWPSPLPSFSLITPNLCDDDHGAKGCAASTGPADICTGLTGRNLPVCNADNWLAVNVPALLSQTPQPIVVVTTDEGKTSLCGDGAQACGGNVMTAVVGPGVVKGGSDLSGPYSHFSLLRGIEGFLGVPCQQGACAAVPLSIPQITPTA